MTNFYVLKLLDNNSIYTPQTLVLNDVEIRSPKADLKKEREAIKKSITERKLDVEIELNARLGTIVQAVNEEYAEALADQNFVKVIDILSYNFHLSNLELSKCGFIKNLNTGQITPLTSPIIGPAKVFIVKQGKYPRVEFSQWIISQHSELSKRFIKSLHWSRLAQWEQDAQIRILFRWFAIEALFKKEETDNIVPLIRWFLGYPNGSAAQHLKPQTIDALQKSKLYKKWKNKIKVSIEAIRNFRNESVHNGLTVVDIKKSDLLLYDKIMEFGCSRCQQAVKQALELGVRTIDEFKEYLSIIFESINNFVDDIHNTILYFLEHDQIYADHKTIYR